MGSWVVDIFPCCIYTHSYMCGLLYTFCGFPISTVFPCDRFPLMWLHLQFTLFDQFQHSMDSSTSDAFCIIFPGSLHRLLLHTGSEGSVHMFYIFQFLRTLQCTPHQQTLVLLHANSCMFPVTTGSTWHFFLAYVLLFPIITCSYCVWHMLAVILFLPLSSFSMVRFPIINLAYCSSNMRVFYTMLIQQLITLLQRCHFSETPSSGSCWRRFPLLYMNLHHKTTYWWWCCLLH